MRNKDFDKIFKDKLSRNENLKQEADWDVFAQLLKNESGFEDLDFDHSIKNKIVAHQDKINPDHWQLLKERIVKEEALRKKICIVKSVELLTLLFMFLGYMAYDSAKFQNSNFVFKFDENSNSGSAVAEIKKVISKGLSNFPGALATLHPLNEIITSEIQDDFANNSDPIARNEAVISREFKNDFSESYKSANLGVSYEYLPKPIQSMTLKNVVSNNTSAIDFGKIYTMPSIVPVDQRSTFIAGFASKGIGITKSSYDRVYNLKAYEAYDNQYSIGLLIGKKQNNIEYSTGLKFTRRSNEPAKVIETYGDFINNYYEISLNKITYNIAEVPVNLKYFFENKGKTNFYVKAGVNANLSLHNTYTITNKPKNATAQFASTKLTISDGDEIEGKAAKSKLTQKDFSPGLLNGGSFSENYFMTASLEVGVERKINHQNTLVFGAEYSKYYMIDGIGPNKEKLNNIALNLSLKHYLN